MKIYFLRHGNADWPDWDQPDDERPLTKKGKHGVHKMTKFLCKLKVRPVLLLSSPLPRASETAEIAAKALDLEVQLHRGLGKGFNAQKLRKMLPLAEGGDLMIVGHEPSFSKVLRVFTGADVKLGKGGVARVDLEEPTSLTGKLV
ncbi:MAG: histidine phosphatase family protein, partial [Verrucomicrobiota bacterium]|nr:histidine phosphatase family protein [Verrucomicrobiota bacterium]